MSEKIKRLAAQMLDDYSDRLGNASCNDWHYPDDWTEQERQDFCRGYHEWNGDPDEYDPDYTDLPDFAVAGYLAHLIAGDTDHE